VDLRRLLGCLFVPWAALAAQDPPAKPASIYWATDFDAALQRAQQEKKPIFVAFLMDDEPANDETIQKHYTDPAIVELTRKFVCLACCIGKHEADADGDCTKFPGITCAEHQAIEKKARARWLLGDEVCTPQHVFCDPQGNVLLRKVYYVPQQTLQKCLAIALNGVAPDASTGKVVDEERARVDSWLADLDSRNQEVRLAAMRELGICEDARALPAVLRHAKGGDDDATRIAAIEALARKGNYAAVEPLLELLADPKPRVVIRVALTLETIQIPTATESLMRAFGKERRDRVRGFLLRAAARCMPANPAVRDACLKALKGASAQLEPCVLIALGRLKADPKIVTAIRPMLRDKNQVTRALAVWVLGSQATSDSAQAISKLLEQEKSPEVRELAGSALKRCNGEKVEGYESMYSPFFYEGDY
jgi:HEAT repeat protein